MIEKEIKKLRKKAIQLRIDVLDSVYTAQSGHIGGSFSIAEIMAYLYFYRMNVNPQKPKDPKRDRFVLSKGHAAPVLYSALAEKRYFNIDELGKLRKIGSILQGHPDMNKTPGVDISTGSLGQGFAAAQGMALGLKLKNSRARVFVILGDGEIEEGEVWETALSAPNFRLGNLTAFLDRNRVQLDGPTSNIMDSFSVVDKFRSFNWNVIEIDGHNIEQIDRAVQECESTTNRPSIIICNTVKAKGVSFMENKSEWHGKAPNLEQYKAARSELMNEYTSI